jgi:DNA-binding MarR family transcriptional regulator
MIAKQEFNFGDEVAKIMPRILRSVTHSQMTAFFKGGITVPQIVILEILMETGPCKMSELAAALHLTMSAITNIVDKMIKLELVKRERSLEDRRVVRVVLRKKGQETAKKIREEMKNIANRIFSPLTEEEKKEYLRLLKKAYVNLR